MHSVAFDYFSVRETDLAGMAQYDLTGIQVGFSDVVEISSRVDVPARPAFERPVSIG
jgi:hypothetical protein